MRPIKTHLPPKTSRLWMLSDGIPYTLKVYRRAKRIRGSASLARAVGGGGMTTLGLAQALTELELVCCCLCIAGMIAVTMVVTMGRRKV